MYLSRQPLNISTLKPTSLPENKNSSVINATTILKQLALLVGSFFLCSSSCTKYLGTGCALTVYTFELPFKARPDTDSIKLGESITFTVDVPNKFIDERSGKEIDYSGAANLGSAIGFVRYDSAVTKMDNAASQFTYSLTKGISVTPYDSTLYREYNFAESNGRYLFELTITPKAPGLYAVVFSNSANTYRGSDPCTKSGFTINLEETSHNRHLAGFYDETIPGGDLYFRVYP